MTNCSICHGPKGAGLLGPNITGSTSAGIGSWTDAQFTTSVRTGVNDKGRELCADMTRFPVALISDAQLTAIHDFLKANINNTANNGTSCPP
jgi:mono/diheme cytochrome c family protein